MDSDSSSVHFTTPVKETFQSREEELDHYDLLDSMEVDPALRNRYREYQEKCNEEDRAQGRSIVLETQLSPAAKPASPAVENICIPSTMPDNDSQAQPKAGTDAINSTKDSKLEQSNSETQTNTVDALPDPQQFEWDSKQSPEPQPKSNFIPCETANCCQPAIFNWQGQQNPTFCLEHKLAGMFPVDDNTSGVKSAASELNDNESETCLPVPQPVVRKCQLLSCTEAATWGFEGGELTTCFNHRFIGMVDLSNPTSNVPAPVVGPPGPSASLQQV